jgi:hypothetical protein
MTKIREALDLLRINGWAHGVLIDKDGQFCMRGALNCAHAGTPWVDFSNEGGRLLWEELMADLDAVADVLGEQFPDRLLSQEIKSLPPNTIVVKIPIPEVLQHASSIPVFNDHPETMFADVEAVMEKAAVNRESEVL